MSEHTFQYEPTFQKVAGNAPETVYRKLSSDHVSTIELDGRTLLKVEQEGLRLLSREAFRDIAFKLRPAHLKQIAEELQDPEASDNDRYVLYTLLQNATIASAGKLPSCQDTGTAIVLGKKGQYVLTDGDDTESLSAGAFDTYTQENLRYSQIAPLEMFKETNTKCNLPAQVDLLSTTGNSYEFLFVAKGGGSANKSYLYQASPAVLNDADFETFVTNKLGDLGTSACPPYHLAWVIGGTSAETNLKIVKLASAGYLDDLPTTGSAGGRAFRDLAWEKRILKIAQDCGIGAQFGGKYFAHDVRVIRMPRHAASCPIGLGVSCSADRNIKAKITTDGIFLEQLEDNPGQFLPEAAPEMAPAVPIDLTQGMDTVRAILTKFPVKTRVSLSGPIIVARDAAHLRIRQEIEAGAEMPDYFKQYPVYYAGPAKTPEGMATGSFGPTTAGRMDGYVDPFQERGGCMVMLAKGNRSQQVVDACKKHGGFYLGSIGGPAAKIAQSHITNVEVIDYDELGMEAVRKITVKDFPAFIMVDDKGNDFFAE